MIRKAFTEFVNALTNPLFLGTFTVITAWNVVTTEDSLLRLLFLVLTVNFACEFVLALRKARK